MKRTSLGRVVGALALGLLVWSAASATAEEKSAEEKSAEEKSAEEKSADSSRGDPMDWPFWRGPEMNGISREKNLPSSWSPDGENVIWKSEELGGRSTPIVMRGKLYTIVRHNPQTLREAEKVVCVDAATGEKLWENISNVFLSDVPDTRVGWSSVVGDPQTGRIYVLGVQDLFQCIDGDTGKTLWSHSLSEEYGMLNTYGGRTNFPVMFENLVIISGVIIGWGDMAKPAHRFIAFDKRNGQPVWFESTRLLPEDTTYSTPALAVINGREQLIFGAGDGSMYGFQPRTGKQIWKSDVSMRGINTSPVVIGNTVICGHSEENIDAGTMGALFAIDASKTGNITDTATLWLNKEQYIGKASPLVVGDRVYAIDDGGTLFVVDFKTGKTLQKQKIGTMGRSSPLYGDGKIYCGEANGRWFIFEITDSGLKKIHQLRLNDEINGSPIISHGRLYVPTMGALYCIGNKDQQPEIDERPEPPRETPVAQDMTPATALVVPCEALLKPGQKLQYQVWLYNANGQFLRVADAKDVKYTVDGPGAVDGEGKYSAPNQREQAAVIVNAQVGELKTRRARIRVIPEIPLTADFEQGEVPITWVGMRYRHIVLDFDLLQALREKDPLAGKLYIYLMTTFINTERNAAKFDNTTPQQAWTQFLRYLDLTDEITSQDEAAKQLNSGLDLLTRENVLASYEWTGTGQTGPRLTVARGSRKIDGNAVMVKISTIPKGTRSQGWFGHPSERNYTIQADVMGSSASLGTDTTSAKMPDIGIIAQRYRLDMLGAGQQLKLYSWYPHDQKYHDEPFEWQPNVWYTVKLQATSEERDGKTVAVLRGKAWPRDKQEPDEWHIEWTDEPANTHGSPGLAGNATAAEVFFDNVKVYRNGSALSE